MMTLALDRARGCGKRNPKSKKTMMSALIAQRMSCANISPDAMACCLHHVHFDLDHYLSRVLMKDAREEAYSNPSLTHMLV
jgi:hypothetical protein